MPKLIIFESKRDGELGKKFINHPIHGYMKSITIYKNYKEADDKVTGVYFDEDDYQHKISSNKISKCLGPDAFNVLLDAIKRLQYRSVYLNAILTLLQRDEDENVSIGTQTDLSCQFGSQKADLPAPVAIRKRKLAENAQIELSDQVAIRKTDLFDQFDTQTELSDQFGTQTELSDQLAKKKRKLPHIHTQNAESFGKIRVTSGGKLVNQNYQPNIVSKVKTTSSGEKIQEMIINGNVENNLQTEPSQDISTRKTQNAEKNNDKNINEKFNFETTLENVITDNFTSILLYDGTKITLPLRPRDIFHLTSPDILKDLTNEQKQKLIVHQAYIDWKYCLRPNQDGFTLIHLAVIHNDTEILKRQIAILKAKGISIDVKARGVTPLHVAIQEGKLECTKLLLRKGANPLVFSQHRRNALHLAALASPQMLQLVMDALLNRTIFSETSRMQAPITYLKRKDIYEVTDEFGYNAFMLACIQGNIEIVGTLFYHHCPSIINKAMPTTGNTALHIVLSEFLANITTGKPSDLAKSQCLSICYLLQFGAATKKPNYYNLTFSEMVRKVNNKNLINFFYSVKNSKHIDMERFENAWSLFLESDYLKQKPEVYNNRFFTDLIDDAAPEDLDDEKSDNFKQDNEKNYNIKQDEEPFNEKSTASKRNIGKKLQPVKKRAQKRRKIVERKYRKTTFVGSKDATVKKTLAKVSLDEANEPELAKNTNERAIDKGPNSKKDDKRRQSNIDSSNTPEPSADAFNSTGSIATTSNGAESSVDTFNAESNVNTNSAESNVDSNKDVQSNDEINNDISTEISDANLYSELTDLYNYLKVRKRQTQLSARSVAETSNDKTPTANTSIIDTIDLRSSDESLDENLDSKNLAKKPVRKIRTSYGENVREKKSSKFLVICGQQSSDRLNITSNKNLLGINLASNNAINIDVPQNDNAPSRIIKRKPSIIDTVKSKKSNIDRFNITYYKNIMVTYLPSQSAYKITSKTSNIDRISMTNKEKPLGTNLPSTSPSNIDNQNSRLTNNVIQNKPSIIDTMKIQNSNIDRFNITNNNNPMRTQLPSHVASKIDIQNSNTNVMKNNPSIIDTVTSKNSNIDRINIPNNKNPLGILCPKEIKSKNSDNNSLIHPKFKLVKKANLLSVNKHDIINVNKSDLINVKKAVLVRLNNRDPPMTRKVFVVKPNSIKTVIDEKRTVGSARGPTVRAWTGNRESSASNPADRIGI